MARSLSDSVKLVPDALRLVRDIAFVPENTLLGSYTFLPWVRGGVGSAIAGRQIANRALVTVAFQVQGEAADQRVEMALQVRGPGDVVGLDERQVIRRYPQPGATNAETTFLAHVEFDRPDLPWLFTPLPALGNRLAPWLVLVVVDQRVSSLRPGHGGLPMRLSTRLGELQPLDDTFAWAHAQAIPVDKGAGRQPSLEDRLSEQYAPINLSRLICPRHLESNRGWIACVVPAYDAGVKAGLGASAPGTLQPAWTRVAGDEDNAIELPVYSSWRFHTGERGDFESLAEKLDGVPAPWQIGRRVMATANPQGGLPPLAAGDVGRLQTVRGPLVSPQKPKADSADADEAAAAIAESAGWPPEQTAELRTLLNAPDRLAGKEGVLSPEERPPLIGPEIYARHHAARARVEEAPVDNWFGELNLRPPHRVVGGLGTRVVQHDQEALMQSAWAQVGDIDAANRQLRGAQLARFVGSAMHERHLAKLSHGDALQITRCAHSRILDGELTVAAAIADSHVADAAVTPAFRRATRPLGLLARHVEGHRGELDRLVAADGTARDFQRPYRELDGVASISPEAVRALDNDLVAAALGVEREDAAQALLEYGEKFEQTVALPDALTVQAIQDAQPDQAFSVYDTAVESLLEMLTGSLPDPAREPARAMSYVQLLIILGDAGGPSSERAMQIAEELAGQLERIFDIGHDRQPAGELPDVLARARDVTPQDALDGLLPIADELVGEAWPGTPVLPALRVERPALIARLDPAVTITARVKERIGAHPSWLPEDWFDDTLINPIMAAPVFTRPMYEALDAYSRNWLIPNLGTLAQPDIVTLLRSNADFIEAFLAGLSHEMGRELLWRGYPTDQRGTYFRRFWQRDKDELTQQLHRFTDTPLGTHVDQSLDGRLVLLVRGELIRRYPDAIVLALRAGGRVPAPDGHPAFIDPVTDPSAMAASLFHAHLAPDIALAGFALTADMVRTQDWWFVIAEHPTGPRFGLDDRVAGAPPHAVNKDTLVWPDATTEPPKPGDLPMRLGDRFLDATVRTPVPDPPANGGQPLSFTFGADGASNAHILLQSPIRAAWNARKLLGDAGMVL